jgi:hypothetical protein
MKLTILDILKASGPMQKMASADLPIATALRLDDDVEVINKILALFEKRRKAAKASFCPTGKDEVPAKKVDAFNAAVDKIAEEEIEIDIKPYPLEDLEGVMLSSGDVKLVRWLIEAPG